MHRLATALAFLLPAAAFAQTGEGDRAIAAEPPADDRWTLGVAVAARDSAYAGEGVRVRPFPYVGYEGERVYWRGVTLGVHLLRTERFVLDAVVAGRFDGFDRGDLGRPELADNGVDADRLADRDDAVDAGLAARWSWGEQELHLRALADVTDTSGGYELSADYGYRFRFGRSAIVPGVGVRWLSEDLADYYYGVRAEETFAGTAYRADAALVPHVGVAFSRPLAGAWRLQGLLQYEWLPDELADSPLLERDASGSGRVMIGVTRPF